ncbi:hypothetical protein Tco_0126615 [Tanacetum coccineum]
MDMMVYLLVKCRDVVAIVVEDECSNTRVVTISLINLAKSYESGELPAKVNKARVIMSSATSAVTYTSVYTDSEPGRAFWGADDEEVSEGGIPRVIVLGYDGLPIQPVAPPSPPDDHLWQLIGTLYLSSPRCKNYKAITYVNRSFAASRSWTWLPGKLYMLLLGTTALSLVTTPLLFKIIPGVVHLGVLLRWFTPDSQTEMGFKGDGLRSDSAKQRIALIAKDLLIHEG